MSDNNNNKNEHTFADVLACVAALTCAPAPPSTCTMTNLDITHRLIDLLHLRTPMNAMHVVHIAGTKGKGTTSAYTAALLQASGMKVGLFTSPHLLDVRERMRINGQLIDGDLFARYFFDLRARIDEAKLSDSLLDREAAHNIKFFGFMFLLAMHIFTHEGVEAAVLEVGMGGRLDSTNATQPRVCAITALGYDHMEVLGNTIEAIAREKAGIMKTNTVCFAAPQHDHPSTRAVLEARAREVEAPLVLLDEGVIPIRQWPPLAIGGAHALEDAKLAVMAARRVLGTSPVAPLNKQEEEVLRHMTFDGRSQVVQLPPPSNATLYLDGAHTPESVQHALEWFMEASGAAHKDAATAPRRVLLLYTSRAPGRILKAFMPHISSFSKIVVAHIINPHMRAATTSVTKLSSPTEIAAVKTARAKEELTGIAQCCRELYREVPCIPCTHGFEAIEELINMVSLPASEAEDASKHAHVFVSGSFFLVAEVLKLLQRGH